MGHRVDDKKQSWSFPRSPGRDSLQVSGFRSTVRSFGRLNLIQVFQSSTVFAITRARMVKTRRLKWHLPQSGTA